MREEDFNTDKLQHYRLISRALCVKYNLMLSDFDLLVYLNPIKYFNRHDFQHGKMTMSWDAKRFFRLQNEGWIKKIHDGRGMKGGHSKYMVSQKGKLMIARLGKIIDGREDIPEINNPKNYKQKILSHSIRKYNEQKYNKWT